MRFGLALLFQKQLDNKIHALTFDSFKTGQQLQIVQYTTDLVVLDGVSTFKLKGALTHKYALKIHDFQLIGYLHFL